MLAEGNNSLHANQFGVGVDWGVNGKLTPRPASTARDDMGTLGDLGLAPSDINNKGQVVGTAGDPSGAIQLAFLWQNGVAVGI